MKHLSQHERSQLEGSEPFQASAVAIASVGISIAALLLAWFVTSSSWVHGDEPAVAALLISASLCCLVSVILSFVACRQRGLKNRISWILLGLAVAAVASLWRTWGIL